MLLTDIAISLMLQRASESVGMSVCSIYVFFFSFAICTDYGLKKDIYSKENAFTVHHRGEQGSEWLLLKGYLYCNYNFTGSRQKLIYSEQFSLFILFIPRGCLIKEWLEGQLHLWRTLTIYFWCYIDVFSIFILLSILVLRLVMFLIREQSGFLLEYRAVCTTLFKPCTPFWSKQFAILTKHPLV